MFRGLHRKAAAFFLVLPLFMGVKKKINNAVWVIHSADRHLLSWLSTSINGKNLVHFYIGLIQSLSYKR